MACSALHAPAQDNDGAACRIKLADFSNAMHATEREISAYYTNFELQSLWYRAPEVMMGVPFGLPIDMWSAGCVIAELFLGEPLFTGMQPAAMLQQIVKLLGESSVLRDLMKSWALKRVDPEARCLACRDWPSV